MTRETINPQMKVGTFLDQYPELEETLIGMAPAFGKLKNPILRRTIARVATLQQAALTGDVSVSELINRLREAAGQSAHEETSMESGQQNMNSDEPDWLTNATERREFDARPMLERGAHPLQEVFGRLNDLPAGAVLELITPFHPAPLVDAVRAKGWNTSSRKEAPDRFVTSIGRMKDEGKE